jgi:hypothetical protein
MLSIPITGGHSDDWRNEETLADAAGASMATFLDTLAETSPSLFRFAIKISFRGVDGCSNRSPLDSQQLSGGLSAGIFFPHVRLAAAAEKKIWAGLQPGR